MAIIEVERVADRTPLTAGGAGANYSSTPPPPNAAARRAAHIKHEKQAKKQRRTVAKGRRQRAAGKAGDSEKGEGGNAGLDARPVIDWNAKPDPEIARAVAAIQRPRWFAHEEGGTKNAYSMSKAKLEPSGWPATSLETVDFGRTDRGHGHGHKSHQYAYFSSSPEDMDDIGGIGLRMYFEYVRLAMAVFLVLGLASVASLYADQTGGPKGHGMFFLPATSRFRSAVAYLTLGNIYADVEQVEAGTVSQLWVNAGVQAGITLFLVGCMFRLARWKKRIELDTDESLISMSDYTVYIRPFEPGCRGWKPLAYGRCHWEWQDGSEHGKWVLPSGNSPAGFARALAWFIEEQDLPEDKKVKIAESTPDDGPRADGRLAKQMWLVLDDSENITLWRQEVDLLYKLEAAMQTAEKEGDCAPAEEVLDAIDVVEKKLMDLNHFNEPPTYQSMRHVVGAFVTLERQSHVKSLLEHSKAGKLGPFNPMKLLSRKSAEAEKRGDMAQNTVFENALVRLAAHEWQYSCTAVQLYSCAAVLHTAVHVLRARIGHGLILLVAAAQTTLLVPAKFGPSEEDEKLEATMSYEPDEYMWENLQFNWVHGNMWKTGIYACRCHTPSPIASLLIHHAPPARADPPNTHKHNRSPLPFRCASLSVVMLAIGISLIIEAEELKRGVSYVDQCMDVLGPNMKAAYGQVCQGATNDPAAREWYKASFLKSFNERPSEFPTIGAGHGCECAVQKPGPEQFGCCNVYRYQTNISAAARTPCTDRTEPPAATWTAAKTAGQCHRVDYDGIIKLYGDIDAMCYVCACHILSTFQESDETRAGDSIDDLTLEETSYLASANRDEAYCEDWHNSYAHTQLLGYVGTLVIVIINQVMKQTLKYLTKFERQDTIGLFQLSLSLKIFGCTMLNTGLLFLVLRSTLFPEVPGDHYENVDAKWYAELGAPLVTTMLTQFITAGLTPLGMTVIQPLMRFFLAKGKKTQNALNAMYTPPEMSLAQMYADCLLGIGVPAIYGAGVPLLYFVSGIGLLLKYSIDKYLVLRHYVKPPLFSSKMFETLIGMNWFFVLCHSAFSVYFMATAGGTDPIRPLQPRGGGFLGAAGLLGFDLFLPHVLPVLAAFVIAVVCCFMHARSAALELLESEALRVKKQHGGFQKVKEGGEIANVDDDYHMDVLEINEELIEVWQERVKTIKVGVPSPDGAHFLCRTFHSVALTPSWVVAVRPRRLPRACGSSRG